jgi:hypothetical protein
MKKFKLLFLCILGVLLLSCEKEFEYPSDSYPTFESGESQPKIKLWGKFKLLNAIMYVKNNEISDKKVYDHFSPSKSLSSMRWGGSRFEIEQLVKEGTTFSFYSPDSYPGYGKFVLNDDETKHYSVYYIGNNKRIVEDPVHGIQQQLMGGTSLPFSGQTIDYVNKIVRIQIFQAQANIGGYNCEYWTELTMEKIEEW